MRIRRKVWRHVPAGAHPLDAGYILRAGGRWNRKGVYGCLYTAFTQRGVRAEYEKALRSRGLKGFELTPREIVSIRADLEPVADLTDKKASPVSPNEQFLTGDDAADLEACRALADSLRSDGFVGIVAPSAALDGEKNLVIYIDGLAKNIRLDDGGDRIPLE